MQEEFDRLDRIRASVDCRPHKDLDRLLEADDWTHPAEVIQKANPERLDQIAELVRDRLSEGDQHAGLNEVARKCWLAASLDRLEDRTCWVHPSTILGPLTLEQLVLLRVGAEDRLQAPNSRPGLRRIAAACYHAEQLQHVAEHLVAGLPIPQMPLRTLRDIIPLAERAAAHIPQATEIASLCKDEISRREAEPQPSVPRIDAVASTPHPMLFWTERNVPLSYDEFQALPDSWWLYGGKLCLTLADIPGQYAAEWRGAAHATEQQRKTLADAPWQGAIVHIPEDVWPSRRLRIQVLPGASVRS